MMTENVADDGLLLIAQALRQLGNGTNVSTGQGALELLSLEVADGSKRIAAAITKLAAAVERVADALTINQHDEPAAYSDNSEVPF